MGGVEGARDAARRRSLIAQIVSVGAAGVAGVFVYARAVLVMHVPEAHQVRRLILDPARSGVGAGNGAASGDSARLAPIVATVAVVGACGGLIATVPGLTRPVPWWSTSTRISPSGKGATGVLAVDAGRTGRDRAPAAAARRKGTTLDCEALAAAASSQGGASSATGGSRWERRSVKGDRATVVVAVPDQGLGYAAAGQDARRLADQPHRSPRCASRSKADAVAPGPGEARRAGAGSGPRTRPDEPLARPACRSWITTALLCPRT